MQAPHCRQGRSETLQCTAASETLVVGRISVFPEQAFFAVVANCPRRPACKTKASEFDSAADAFECNAERAEAELVLTILVAALDFRGHGFARAQEGHQAYGRWGREPSVLVVQGFVPNPETNGGSSGWCLWRYEVLVNRLTNLIRKMAHVTKTGVD